MSNEPKQPDLSAADTKEVYASLKTLVIKMLNIETDPDLISVFSIARAHGYKPTSPFWSKELKESHALLTRLEPQPQAPPVAAPWENAVPFDAKPVN